MLRATTRNLTLGGGVRNHRELVLRCVIWYKHAVRAHVKHVRLCDCSLRLDPSHRRPLVATS
eukprot:36787-Eustigmatos_ZCMA.PRE.1